MRYIPSSSPDATAATPQAIRSRLRAERTALAPDNVADHSRKVCLLAWDLLNRLGVRTLAAYLPTGNEIDLHPLLEQAAGAGIRIALPRMHPWQRGAMQFLEWQPGERLRRNAFGIAEPAKTAHRLWRREIHLLLAPLVAFDAAGYRLGMGGGYYDRYLAHRRLGLRTTGPLFFGVAHSFQEVPQLIRQPWDIRLDGIITESALRCFRPIPGSARLPAHRPPRHRRGRA